MHRSTRPTGWVFCHAPGTIFQDSTPWDYSKPWPFAHHAASENTNHAQEAAHEPDGRHGSSRNTPDSQEQYTTAGQRQMKCPNCRKWINTGAGMSNHALEAHMKSRRCQNATDLLKRSQAPEKAPSQLEVADGKHSEPAVTKIVRERQRSVAASQILTKRLTIV